MLTPINLQLGWPSPYLFPASSILKGASAVLTDSSKIASGLIYGPDEGYVPLRKSIAEWLSSTYTHSPASPDHERICITNGASGNLANVLQKFTDPEYTRIVWMVEPSYFLACPIFHDAGFEGKLRGVPEDEEGLDIAFLRSSLQAVEKKVAQGASEDVPLLKAGAGYVKLYKHVIYIVPTFSNPSAKTLSLRRREELVRLAREFDALVVTDDVYDVLRWPEDPNAPVGQLGKPPPRIVDVDSTLDGGPADQWGNTVSNGSFSKIIAPGCRVGWAEGTPAFTKQLSQVGSTRSGGAPSHLSSTFVHEMLESGSLDMHINDTLVPVYRARYYTLMNAIQGELVPLGFEVSVGKPYEASLKSSKFNGTNGFNGTDGTNGTHMNDTTTPTREAGGFFTYLLLPADIPSASALAATALEKYELKFAFGDMFQVAGDAGSADRAEKGYGRGIRLCWAWHTEEEIKDGIRRLAAIAKETKSGKA